MKIHSLILLYIIALPALGAALPFTGPTRTDAPVVNALSAKVSIQMPDSNDLDEISIRLTNVSTGEVIQVSRGDYQISEGEYELLAYKSLIDDIDESFKQYRTSISVRAGETVSVSIPALQKRRFTQWHDYLTVSLQMANIGDEYEVSGILKEFYDQQSIANNFPAINAIAENDTNAQSRTGLALNYKHMFADSDWMFYADYFIDQDSDSNLNRSGFGIGAGKYWDNEKSTFWLAGGVGSETAAWNDINVGGNSSIDIAGEHDNQTLNVEGGIIYRPFNISASARLDILNQTVTFNLGYIFGGKKQGFIDPKFVQ
jgi:hypothetical protein